MNPNKTTVIAFSFIDRDKLSESKANVAQIMAVVIPLKTNIALSILLLKSRKKIIKPSIARVSQGIKSKKCSFPSEKNTNPRIILFKSIIAENVSLKIFVFALSALLSKYVERYWCKYNNIRTTILIGVIQVNVNNTSMMISSDNVTWNCAK